MIAVIFHRLGPYHFARLRAAGRSLSVVAIETSGTDETYAWDVIAGADGFERVTLFAHADAQKQPAREVARRMVAALDNIRPAVVVVPGWADAAALAALQWCGRHRVPAVIMSESTAWDEPRRAWREVVKQQVVSLAAAGLVGGTPHQEYIIQLGLPAERVFLGYDVVDNEYFAQRAAQIRNQPPETRKKQGLPGKYFLASARFIEKKNLRWLIEAYACYRELASKSEIGNRKSEIWNLVLLGDGELRGSLDQQLSTLNLQPFVQLPGFKQYSDLPEFYAPAGAFIHASTAEPWGLVVNEAMACSLPVLVSNRCGCARDLVQEGVNGFTFDPFNVEELANLMLRISAFREGHVTPGAPCSASDPTTSNQQPAATLSQMGADSARLIASWGPDRFAAGLNAAVDKALEMGPVKASLVQRAILQMLLKR